MNLNVLLNSHKQLEAALGNAAVRLVYIEADLINNAGEKREIIDSLHKAGKEAGVALPYIFRDTAYIDVSGYDCVLIRSLDELECYKNCRLVSDYGLYAMNSGASAFLEDRGVQRLTIPVELNEHEISHLSASGKEMIVYGHIPMMITAQCLRKNTVGCDKKRNLQELTDRTGKRMPVENKCAYCCNLIYNALPLSLAGVFDKVRRLGPSDVRINLTTEDYDKSVYIIETFASAVAGNKVDDPVAEFTRGHFTRGVE